MWLLFLLSFILLGGALGYSLSAAALWNLFRPYRPIELFNRRLPLTPGLIARKRLGISQSLSRALGEAILPHISLFELVRQPSFQRYVDEAIGEGIDRRLGSFGVMDSLRPKLRQQLSRAALRGLEALLRERESSIFTGVDLEPLIEAKLGALDGAELEGAVKEVAGRELRLLKYAGGALGGIVGLFLGALALLLR